MLTATGNTNKEPNKNRYGDADIESYDSCDRYYERCARDTSSEYREHLYDALSRNKRALASGEYEDERRYESMERDIRPERRNPERFRVYEDAPATRIYDDASATRTHKDAPSTRRVLKKKMIPLLACYFLVIAAVLTLIVFNVSGTAWEAEKIVINPGANILPQETASAENSQIPAVAMNTVATDNGAVLVSLSPYPAAVTYEEDTNWFDKLCDFIGRLSGG